MRKDAPPSRPGRLRGVRARTSVVGSSRDRARDRNAHARGNQRSGNELVHVAVTYAEDGTIAVYRDGSVYGAPYVPTGPQSELQAYKKGQSFFLFGKRHARGGRPFFAGEIEEARVYDRALSSAEIAASFAGGP